MSCSDPDVDIVFGSGSEYFVRIRIRWLRNHDKKSMTQILKLFQQFALSNVYRENVRVNFMSDPDFLDGHIRIRNLVFMLDNTSEKVQRKEAISST